VSRHLSILKAAGLVAERREGRWCHYRIASEAPGFAGRLLSLLDTWGGEDDVVTRDWRTAEELRRKPART
jgi:DNA-binding transcriptional ArsR family regulator